MAAAEGLAAARGLLCKGVACYARAPRNDGRRFYRSLTPNLLYGGWRQVRALHFHKWYAFHRTAVVMRVILYCHCSGEKVGKGEERD